MIGIPDEREHADGRRTCLRIDIDLHRQNGSHVACTPQQFLHGHGPVAAVARLPRFRAHAVSETVLWQCRPGHRVAAAAAAPAAARPGDEFLVSAVCRAGGAGALPTCVCSSPARLGRCRIGLRGGGERVCGTQLGRAQGGGRWSISSRAGITACSRRRARIGRGWCPELALALRTGARSAARHRPATGDGV
jgi:hypothetical protein